MKTKEYVSKYNLNKGINFNHNGFISDLTFDFITLLEVGNSTKNIKGYENAVRAIRMKWDAISNKTAGVLPDKLWNYFYASVIAKTRNELFPDVMAKREQEKREREQRRKEYEEFERREFFGGFDSGFFWNFLLASMVKDSKPIESFKVLGLDSDSSSDDVKNAYRQLSMQHHPDKGGNSDKFIEITEAKNKCLAYLS